MARYNFSFKGGHTKGGGVTSKFYLFCVIPSEEKADEVIFFDARKKGLITENALLQMAAAGTKEEQDFDYSIATPYVKIFSLVEGFGLSGGTHYHSFFFKLSHEGRVVTIKPLAATQNRQANMFFKGQGHFLSPEEVKSLLGDKSTSYGFYKKQCPLPRAILNTIVSIELPTGRISPGTSEVRRVRL